MKRWTVSRGNEAAAKRINSSTDLGPLLSEIMAARGLDTLEKLADFFNGSELSDPFLLLDMQNAVDEINSKVDSGELICIYGDYDCDGITATAVLYSFLESMGANVSYYIPERADGYGLNADAVRKIAEQGAGLIITVDNGISAIDEARLIAELGMSLVITDHHQPTETLPEAAAVVDPHRPGCPSPFKHLCGAGVVLKLCAALDGGSFDAVCEQYLDLVAIATVADVVPLIGENRVIVSQGLRLLRNTENVGLLALLEECGADISKITSTSLAFTVAPRINASSRFGSPKTALDMLLSEDSSAEEYARELDRLNACRRTTEAEVYGEIMSMIDSEPSLLFGRTLTVSGNGWHRGVIGIVAAKLVEQYGKPAIVISSDGSGLSCGSARSVEGFNIFNCFNSCRDILVKYGGHELAGGLTVKDEDIPALIEKIEDHARSVCPEMPRMTLKADKLLTAADMTVDNVASLTRVEPCGQSNPEPLFAISGAEIKAVYPLKAGEHTKIEIEYGGARAAALLFRVKTRDFGLGVNSKIDLMANMSVNEYKGIKSLTLRVQDYRPHGAKQDRYFAAVDAYESFRRKEPLPADILKRGNPTRDELVSVYKYITAQNAPINLENLCISLAPNGFNAFKLRIIADAFCDAGLLRYTPSAGLIEPAAPTKRVDIDSCATLTELRSLIQGGDKNA